MRDDGQLAHAAVRRLPPAALAALREAFAAELAERLPRLCDAVRRPGADRLGDAVRDAHALGSSAAVVGERGASRHARAAEAALTGPEPDWVTARLEVDRLTAALAGWAP